MIVKREDFVTIFLAVSLSISGVSDVAGQE